MLDQRNYDRIAIEKRPNGVAIATLDRPEKLNAVDGVLHSELTTLPSDADADRSVKVLVITGAGRAFCAGGDFSGARIGDWEGAKGDTWTEARMIVDHLLECSKPVISAVNGYAMGLGATIALLCDIVVAGPHAVFADTHVKMGIGAGDGGQLTWPFLMGMSRAKYYLMTGDRVSAEEAERLGLVTFLAEDCVARAVEIADRLAAGPSQAISASKVPFNNWLRAQSALIMPQSLYLEERSAGSRDADEARLAFQEKREPRFTGD